MEWAPKSYCSGLQRAIGVGSKELKEALRFITLQQIHEFAVAQQVKMIGMPKK